MYWYLIISQIVVDPTDIMRSDLKMEFYSSSLQQCNTCKLPRWHWHLLSISFRVWDFSHLDWLCQDDITPTHISWQILKLCTLPRMPVALQENWMNSGGVDEREFHQVYWILGLVEHKIVLSVYSSLHSCLDGHLVMMYAARILANFSNRVKILP